ncbi:hypothetical protein C0J52_07735 [Blattella germanica]|nr:hypothetical protein C0J52_07735 [Blattella germanica]
MSVRHVPRKSNVLSRSQIDEFLLNAPDDVFLLIKVVIAFGVFGAYRRQELHDLCFNDVKVEGSVLVVRIAQTKNYKPRTFTIVPDGVVNCVALSWHRATSCANGSHRKLHPADAGQLQQCGRLQPPEQLRAPAGGLCARHLFFWVLALDHDLRVANDIIGSVFVRNPAGTKVALWEEVALDEGVKSFSMALSEEAQLGNWQVQVQVETAVFTSELNVSLTGGTSGITIPEVAMAEEHYVEAMSTEKSVRVRVKVYDNTTAIYSQDIEITSGEGTFIVPAILADSEPEEEAHVTVLSTCPCERDLHYVVTTEGHVTFWSQALRPDSVDETPPTQMVDGAAICRLNFSKRRASGSKELDFATAGMAFFERRCVRQGGPWSESSTQLFRQGGSAPSSISLQQRHSSVVGSATIDELWLWKCFNYSGDMVQHTLISAPQEPGKWSLWALTLSPSVGLRFSPPQTVTVFRPLQVDFKLPTSLRVGEAVEVDVKIGNNINSCMDVTALLALSEGAHFLSNGMLYVTEKLRLGPHGATSLVVRVVVTSPGLKNMTAEVSGYGSDTCHESGNSPGNSSLVGSVLRSAAMLVHPEGLVRTDTESAYFCANENVVISTSENFRYEFVSAPRNRAGIVFEVKVAQGAHIALSDTLWVTWDKGTVAVGQGPVLHNRTLLKWRMDKKLKVQHIGFASGWGHMAEFRVWNYNDEAGFSQVLHLDVPRSVVPGSEQGTLMITGGLALPVSPQRHHPGLGLGESTSLAATMSTFTPLLVLEHMTEHNNVSSSNPLDQTDAIHWLSTQLQSLLRFMKPDFSFGDHHRLGSHSNTVSVLELLAKSQSYTSVDPVLVAGIKRWIQQRQGDDGSFSPLPMDTTTVTPKNLSDTHFLERQVELTAETLVTLLQVDWETMLRARYFLERSVFRVDSPCPLSLMTYVLVLAKSELSGIALDRLRNASTNEEGDFGWQHLYSSKDAPDWLYEEGSGRHRKEPIMTSVGEYKASLYALMTYSHLGDLKSAEPVARYLFYRSHLLDRHAELLYAAVKAFSSFSWLAVDRHRALTVSLATSGMELTDTLELRPDSSPQSLQLPSLPTKVFVYATGAGCATVQIYIMVLEPTRYVGSLRPAFARVYPAGRSDLGAETFFHTRRESPLLDGLTDDDLITWFGKTGSGKPQLSSNFSEMCECGQTCPNSGISSRESDKGGSSSINTIGEGNINENVHHIISDMDATNIIIFNKQIIENETMLMTSTESSLEISNVSLVNVETTSAFVTEPVTNSTRTDVQFVNPASTVSATDEELQSNRTTTATSNITSKYTSHTKKVQIGIPSQADPVSTTQPSSPLQPARSINKERQHIASDVLPPTLTTEQSSPPQHGGLDGSDKLFVLDRDTLWGMLREVVHVELDKKQLNLDDASNQSDHLNKSDID